MSALGSMAEYSLSNFKQSPKRNTLTRIKPKTKNTEISQFALEKVQPYEKTEAIKRQTGDWKRNEALSRVGSKHSERIKMQLRVCGLLT